MLPEGGVLSHTMTASGASDAFPLPVNGGRLDSLSLSSVVTALTAGASMTVALEVKGGGNVWQPVAALSPQTAVGGAAVVITGPALTASLGNAAAHLVLSSARLRWTVSGTAPMVTAVLAATAA